MDHHTQSDVAKTHKNPNYFAVFIALAVITAIITGVEFLSHSLAIPRELLNSFFVLMAVTKATLVAMFYMHLKQDSRLYTVLFGVPVMFAVILMFMLLI